MPFEKDPNEIGCLWEKSGKHGPYLTGTINGQVVVCFGIRSKNVKAPNWRVLKATPQSGPLSPKTQTDDLEDF